MRTSGLGDDTWPCHASAVAHGVLIITWYDQPPWTTTTPIIHHTHSIQSHTIKSNTVQFNSIHFVLHVTLNGILTRASWVQMHWLCNKLNAKPRWVQLGLGWVASVLTKMCIQCWTAPICRSLNLAFSHVTRAIVWGKWVDPQYPYHSHSTQMWMGTQQ